MNHLQELVKLTKKGRCQHLVYDDDGYVRQWAQDMRRLPQAERGRRQTTGCKDCPACKKTKP